MNSERLEWRKRDGVFRSAAGELNFYVVQSEDHYTLYVNNWGMIRQSAKLKAVKRVANLIAFVLREEYKPAIRYEKKGFIWKEGDDGIPLKVGLLPPDPKYEIETDHEKKLRLEFGLDWASHPTVIPLVLEGPLIFGHTKAAIMAIIRPKAETSEKQLTYTGEPLHQTPNKRCRVVCTLVGFKIPKLVNTKYSTIRKWVKRVRRISKKHKVWPTIGALRHFIHNQTNIRKKEVALEKLNLICADETRQEELIFNQFVKRASEQIVKVPHQQAKKKKAKKKKSKKKSKR